MIEALGKSVSNSLNERIRSPLFGTFLLSWVTWNWKIFYSTIFFESEKIGSSRIQYIDSLLAKTQYSIWGPLVTTLIIILIIPSVRIGVYWIEEWYNQKRNNLAQKFSDRNWLPPEIAKSLRKQIREQEDEYEKLLNKKELQIEKLNKEVEKHVTNINENRKQHKREIEASENVNFELREAVDKLKSEKEKIKLESQNLRKANHNLNNELIGIHNEVSLYINDIDNQETINSSKYISVKKEFNEVKSLLEFKKLFSLLKGVSNLNVSFNTDKLLENEFKYLVNRNIIEGNWISNDTSSFLLTRKGKSFIEWNRS